MTVITPEYSYFPSNSPSEIGGNNICEFGMLRNAEGKLIPVAVRTRLHDNEDERNFFEQEHAILEELQSLDVHGQYFALYYGRIDRSLCFKRYDCDLEKIILNRHVNPVTGHAYNDLEISHFAEQIIHAVAYLHRYNLVHRDIKPKNILVSTHAVLCDFESCRGQETLEARLIEGTPLFFPPEFWFRVAQGYQTMEEAYQPESNDAWRTGFTINILLHNPTWLAEVKAIIDNATSIPSASVSLFSFLVRHIEDDNETIFGLLNPDPYLRKSVVQLSNEIQEGELQ